MNVKEIVKDQLSLCLKVRLKPSLATLERWFKVLSAADEQQLEPMPDGPACSVNRAVLQSADEVIAELKARAVEAKLSASDRWRFAAERKLGDYECGIGIGKEMLADEVLGWLDDLSSAIKEDAGSIQDESTRPAD